MSGLVFISLVNPLSLKLELHFLKLLQLNVIPLKGGFNLAKKIDLNFIESNKIFTNTLEKILGKNYECLLKKISEKRLEEFS